ncbi:hypothetical protein Tco_0279364 [Tanacetum coccineum]
MAGKLSHIIKELKQGDEKMSRKQQRREKRLEVARQRVRQSFSPNLEISFPTLGDEDGMKGPMIIEAEIGVTSYFANM